MTGRDFPLPSSKMLFGGTTAQPYNTLDQAPPRLEVAMLRRYALGSARFANSEGHGRDGGAEPPRGHAQEVSLSQPYPCTAATARANRRTASAI
jgi:hypothetical protein